MRKEDEGGDAYIYRAAAVIGRAQRLENARHHQAAFDAYKHGVGILLAGVQTDNDLARREVVRQRTGRYLITAEAIFNQFLHPGESSSQVRREAEKLEPAPSELRWKVSPFGASNVEIEGRHVFDLVLLRTEASFNEHRIQNGECGIRILFIERVDQCKTVKHVFECIQCSVLLR